MANRVETTLSYKLDARGLRQARQEFERTFQPQSARTLNKTLGETKRIIKAISTEQARLTTEMMKVKRGTEAYKQLEKALKGVNKEMQNAAQAQRALEGAQGASGARGGQGGGGRGGFWATAGGAAVGAYAGSRAGMARAGGLFTGGGPLSTTLQGVPLLGGLAAMAEGAVERGRQFDMARQQAFPFLSGRDLIGGGNRMAGAGRAARGRVPRAEPGATPGGRAIAKGILDTLTGRDTSFEDRITELTGGDKPGTDTFAKRRAQAQGRARSAQLQREVSESSFRKIGFRAGLDRTQTMQQAAQLGRTIGQVNEGQFEQAMAGRMFGVDTQTTGRMFRQQRAGRGGTGNVNSLARTIAAAVSMGMEGSEINEHLSTMVQLQEQAEQQGLKISSEGFNALTTGLAGAGLAGPQAGRVGSGMARFGQQVASSGVQGPVDVSLLRAAGWSPGGGRLEYIRALKRVEQVGEGGLTPEVMSQMIQGITGGIQNQEEAGFVLRRALGSRGIRMGFGQAESLVAGARGGSLTAADLSDAGVPTTAEGLARAGGMREKGGELAKALTASQRRQAALNNTLIGVGRKVGPTVDRLNQRAAKLANKAGDLESVLTKIDPTLEKISDFFGEGITELVTLLNKAIDLVQSNPNIFDGRPQ